VVVKSILIPWFFFYDGSVDVADEAHVFYVVELFSTGFSHICEFVDDDTWYNTYHDDH
jgi:hypothetical protein